MPGAILKVVTALVPYAALQHVGSNAEFLGSGQLLVCEARDIISWLAACKSLFAVLCGSKLWAFKVFTS